MLNDEQRYLISELHNYNYLHQKLGDITEEYARSLHYLDEKIKAIDEELNSYHVPSIRYDKSNASSMPSTKNVRVLELITEQEGYVRRKAELKNIQSHEVEAITTRVDYITTCLNHLDRWENQYINDMYIHPKGIDFMIDTYHYSKSQIYRKATNLLNKMLSHRK